MAISAPWRDAGRPGTIEDGERVGDHRDTQDTEREIA